MEKDRYLLTIDYYDLYVGNDYYAINVTTKEKIKLNNCWNIGEAKTKLRKIINNKERK